jgi:hypothetical protein
MHLDYLITSPPSLFTHSLSLFYPHERGKIERQRERINEGRSDVYK